MLARWIRGQSVFTERDWLFLFGHAAEKVLSLHLWLRFAVLWLAVVLIGFIEGYVLFPFGLAAFLDVVFLTALVVWLLRRSGYVEASSAVLRLISNQTVRKAT